MQRGSRPWYRYWAKPSDIPQKLNAWKISVLEDHQKHACCSWASDHLRHTSGTNSWPPTAPHISSFGICWAIPHGYEILLMLIPMNLEGRKWTGQTISHYANRLPTPRRNHARLAAVMLRFSSPPRNSPCGK
jgi:hypothetical protein